MLINKGYKTELDLNNYQRTSCRRHAGAARYAYNWGLRIKKDAMDKKEKIPTSIDLHKKLNRLKKTELPWMYDSSKCAPHEALRNLDNAFGNFFRKCKLKKQGKLKGKVGFPVFKTKKKGLGSFSLNGTIIVYDNKIQLPNLGVLRFKESDYLPTKDVKILGATISEHTGKWYVSLRVEEEIQVPEHKPEAIVGVDLGIKTMAVCSDGTVFENPKALHRNLRKLRRFNRKVARSKKRGNNRRKEVHKLARLHARISNIRTNALHQATSWLTKTKSIIVREDLNVAGMVRNRKLAKAISDVGFGEFARQLDYKGIWYGCKILVADRFYPSSKTCSACGFVNDNLKLSDREWVCPKCGVIHDRDMNASVNLEKLAVRFTDSINACVVGKRCTAVPAVETCLDAAGT
jgi:putative transposase